MLRTILIALITLNTYAAHAKLHKVLVRKKDSDDQKILRKKLPNLTSRFSFEGKYFKVVKGRSNEAVKFNEKDSNLKLKAATVYYHASVARTFFVNQVGSTYVANLPQIVLRIDIVNKYSKAGHFAHEKNEPQYNNALTIPPGKTPSFVPVKDEWNHEIWFRPKKTLKTADMDLNVGENPLASNLRVANDVVQDYAVNSVQFDMLNFLFNDGYQAGPLWQDMVRHAGTIAVFHGIFEVSKRMDNLFLNSHYYLDTALVPEIIYHEFAHIALSDSLETTTSTPVVEGMADFFATMINPQDAMMAPIEGISNNSSKNPYNKTGYTADLEALSQSQSDFVLSVLWKLHENLDGGALDLIYRARKQLSTDSSNIRNSLPRTLMNACRFKKGVRALCRREVLKTIKSKGF